ncbi:MAG: class I SAM-dependent methyltransferase [Nanobdellota archaeon]
MNQWDAFAHEYDQLVGDTGDFYHRKYLNPRVLSMLGDITGKKVLDLACGNGYFTHILSNRGARAIGVDYSHEMIKLAQNHHKGDFRVGNAINLSMFGNSRFDIIVANMALHDLKNVRGAIKECARIIKRNGRFIFSIPHPAFYLSKRKKDSEYVKEVRRYLSVFSIAHPIYANVGHNHRPLQYYFKALFKNSFVVCDFIEMPVKHSGTDKVEDPELLRFKGEIPTFLIVEARYI